MDLEWIIDAEESKLKDAWHIRKKVFIEEQRVEASIELDGLDQTAIHLIGYINQQPVANARIILKNNDTIAKIQRVAVLKEHRHQKLGSKLMHEIERWAKEHPTIQCLQLSSQDAAIPFYESLGFTVSNNTGYLDANIPHHDMEKKIA